MSTERWTPPELLPKPSTHYSNPGKVEPIDLIDALNLDFFEGNIVKYVCRYKKKDGLRDLQKARQYLDWLIIRMEREQSYSHIENKGMDTQPYSTDESKTVENIEHTSAEEYLSVLPGRAWE